MRRISPCLLVVAVLAGGCQSVPATSTASPSSASPATASPSPEPTPTEAAQATPTESPAETQPTATSSERPEVLYSCGEEPGFGPSALEGPTGAERGDGPAAETLREFLESPEREEMPDRGWRELFRSEKEVVFGADAPSREHEDQFPYVEVEDEGDAWEVVDDGDCRPTAFFEGAGPAEWRLAGERPGPEARRLDVLVNEQACASGRSAEGRIREPVIQYDEERIVITFRVEPNAGGQDCQANPDTPYTVELEEPLGDRKLLDGIYYPPIKPGSAHP